MVASTFTDPKPRGVPNACARISSHCSSGTVTKYQRPALSPPFQIQTSEVTLITDAEEPLLRGDRLARRLLVARHEVGHQPFPVSALGRHQIIARPVIGGLAILPVKV